MIHRTYEPGEIDAIGAYCDELRSCYLLPAELCVGRANIQLRLSPPRNHQERFMRWAHDYEFGATIEKLYGPIAQLGERQRGTLEAAGSSPAGSTGEPPTGRLSLFSAP